MKVHRLVRYASLLTLSWAMAGAWALAVDVSVSSIEVTQSTQDVPGHTVSLVARRSTAVRATLAVADSPGAVAGVDGVLRVFVGGIEITPPAGIAPINAPFSAPLAPSRSSEDDTLNFELAAPTGITASSDVDFQVTISAPGDTDPGNDTATLDDLTFEARDTPLIFFTRIDYTPSGLGLPALGDVSPGVGDAFVQGIYPVDDSDPLLYQEGIFPTLPFSGDEDMDGTLEGCGSPPTDSDDLLAFLEACRQLIVDSGVGSDTNIFLYAWLAGNPIAGNGCAPIGGRVGYGNTQDTRYQRTFAHELGHNFGFVHADGGLIDEVGWDVLGRLPGNPAGNNTTGRVKPTTLNDIMTGGLLTNQAWIKTANYETLFDHAAIAPDGGGEPDLAASVMLVRGVFDPNGNTLIRLLPSFRFPWLARPSQSDVSSPGPLFRASAPFSGHHSSLRPPGRRDRGVGRRLRTMGRQVRSQQSRPEQALGLPECSLSVEVLDSFQNLITTPGNSTLGDDASSEGCGFFSLMVPVDPNARANMLQVRNAQGQTVGSMTATAVAPTVDIVEPAPGANLDSSTSIRWQVSDPDSDPSDLMFQVAYSPDGGSSFVPIGVDLLTTELILDAGEVEPSQGTGLIRVFVSDGLNTTFTDVRFLSTDRAPDCSAAVAGTRELWPPNHKLVSVPVEGVIDPDGGGAMVSITGIRQDEPVAGPGAGSIHCPDGTGIGSDTALLRSERSGQGDGRVYHISFEAVDPAGNQCTGSVRVCVPHDQSGRGCVDQGPLFDATGPCS